MTDPTKTRNGTPTRAQRAMTEGMTCADHNDEDMPRSNYNAAHEWADTMLATHVQLPCPECGLWRIWLDSRSHIAAALEGTPDD